MESGKVFDIPCNLMDIRNMEKFLEQKAREGYVLERYRWLFFGSVFQEMPEDEYCFHIDLYHRRLKKADLESEEFLKHVESFEACGWTLRCVYANLVFFCSRGSERPPLPAAAQKDQAELLRDVTRKAARRQMICQAGWKLAVLAALEALLMWRNRDGNILREPGLYIPLTWLFSTILLDFFRYFTVARRVKQLKAPLEGRMIWDEWFLGLLVFMAGTAGSVIYFWADRNGAFLWLSFAVIMSSGFLLGYRIRRYTRGKEAWKVSWVEIAGYLVPCILLIALCSKMPFPGNFRYQLENGESHFDISLSGSRPAPEITELGLTQKELGWGESDVIFSHENPNHLCRWEWIAYSQESIQEFYARALRDDVKDSRYIGTMMAKLKDPGKLEDFLRQKKLNPKEGVSFDLVPGIRSWIWEGGKTLLHVKGDLAVIHFLNLYDPRQFDVEDPIIREAVRRNLEAVIEKEELIETYHVEQK